MPRLARNLCWMILLPLWLAPPSAAQQPPPMDRALVIGNQNYADAADIPGAANAPDVVAALKAAGFAVTAGQDLTAGAMRSLLSEMRARSAEGRVLMLIEGHFAQSDSMTWVLGTDASLPDLATVSAVGLPLAAILDIAATAPGGAVVVLGTEPHRLPLGPGLEPGIGPVAVPQGVTLVRGDAARVAEFAASALTRRGQSLAALLDAEPDLTADGFLAPLVPFRPALGEGPNPSPADPEAAFWDSVKAQGTLTAFQAYLQRFPKGRYLTEARAEISRIQAEPDREARAAEEALGLSRDDRRAIQRALSLVGQDPKGIDGMFGAASRQALAAWQKRNGYAATGYLGRDQIVKLTEQADAASARIEAEAAETRKATEAADRAFWAETGAKGDEAGLRAYLRRWPDGLYADLAKDRLRQVEADRVAEGQTADGTAEATTDRMADRTAWELANRDPSIAGYRDYLSGHPEGAFAAEARARIAELEGVARPDVASARWERAEAALALGQAARRVIETRLDALGLKPGPVDGTFDDRTRRAIRRFQEVRNMTATGYLDQPTTVALLAGAALRLGE